MGKVVKFPFKAPQKFGLRRVKRKQSLLEKHGQLNVFTAESTDTKVVRMPSHLSPFEEALVFDDSGDQKAREFYWKAISAGDCEADAYCNLGILEFKENQNSQAIDCFTNSLKKEPRHFEAHYNLANLYAEVGNLSLAKVHYEVAAFIKSEFPNTYFNLGLVHAMNKDFQEAIDALFKYKKLVHGKDEYADELLSSLKKSLTNHPKIK